MSAYYFFRRPAILSQKPMNHPRFIPEHLFPTGARLTPAPVGRVTPCAPSWRTQTPPLAGIARVNQRVLVCRRRRAEDCPPHHARITAACPSPRSGGHPACRRAGASSPAALAPALTTASLLPTRLHLRHWLLGVVAVRKDCWLLDVSPSAPSVPAVPVRPLPHNH